MRSPLQKRSIALARLCQSEVLGPDEERRLFGRLKRASREASRSRGERRSATSERRASGPTRRAIAIRNQIALSNLRLVVSVAKRFASPQQSVEDLVSEASLLLLRCVERFDPGRGTRFSTYATRALAHHFVRLRKRERRRAVRSLSFLFFDRALPGPDRCEGVARMIHQEDCKRLRAQLGTLPSRERNLLAGRYGLGGNTAPQTFRELAAQHGLSKEWARVTTAGAIETLRKSLADE